MTEEQHAYEVRKSAEWKPGSVAPGAVRLSSSEQLFWDAWHEWSEEGTAPIPQYKLEGIPGPFDFAWPLCQIAVEVYGYGGGHQRPERQAADAAKIRAAMMLGWTVIPVTSACLGSKAKRQDLVSDVWCIINEKGTWGEVTTGEAGEG